MSKRRRTGICAYCGESGNITRDHVIPRCLFPRPLPQDMLTVPACDSCNGRKSRHDDFLRDILVTDIAATESPVAQELFRVKVLSSHQQGKSLASRIALTDSKPIPFLTREGECDVAFASNFDTDRAN